MIVDHRRSLAIHDLEKRLKQGKLSFASGERMQRYLGLNPGSVSPFGLIHDPAQHVYLFLDKNLKNLPKISFHPNDNTASLVIRFSDFLRFLDHCGNGYEFIELYSPEDVM